MKRITFFLLFVLSALAATAQNISVSSFQPLPTDMTAGSLDGKRIDQNNEVAALIKIVTTQTGFTFEAGALGIVDTRQEAGEVWVWVPRGSRKITIKHPQLGVLREYRYPIEILPERTYEMVLVTGTVETIVKEQVREQYLMFQITPVDAILEVDDQVWKVSGEGTARKLVDFGTYTYRVQAPNYHPEAGQVTVNDPNGTKKVTVNLRPNFGWVEVPSSPSLNGAIVYVDNAMIGRVPCKSEPLKSGQHSVKIAKELYETYNQVVTVTDNETTRVTPTLTANFAHVTLQVDADAEIWVNDERKGTRSWSGDLESGSYKIECKMENHEPTAVKKEITSQMNGDVIHLNAPRPIYGSLIVESTPDMAELFIDGKSYGETPKLIPEILIGQHDLRLSKKGYGDYTTQITIKKGERSQVDATLSNGKEIRFTCNVNNALLEIDGQQVGSASGTYMLTYGQHSLKATADNFVEYTTTLTITENSSSHSITLNSKGNGAIGQFFPLFGFTLGQTTWEEAKDKGYELKNASSGKGKYAYVNKIYFWDHDATGIFTSIYWTHYDGAFPESWKRLGFSWDNSYNDWLNTFRNLGYAITISEAPQTKTYSGRKTLSADVKTLSPDGTLEFKLDFDYGNNNHDGYKESSPRSLYGITITYKGQVSKASQSTSSQSSTSNNTQTQYTQTSQGNALPGVFSVSPTKRVYFAKGNVQYQASSKTWRFAEHQWDVIGKENKNISPSYSGWIDLFGWGTGDDPTKASRDDKDYSTFTDWGQNFGNGWSTLTEAEWTYIIDTRNTSSGLRFAKAKVNGVYGIILLPDNWNSSNYQLRDTNNKDAKCNSNTISADRWTKVLEANGAVFLPAAGFRFSGSTVIEVKPNPEEQGWIGRYHCKGSRHNKSFCFSYNWFPPISDYGKPHEGISVRLVRPAN